MIQRKMTEKLSDKELNEEIEKNKTEKEIAYDNGYGYPSRALNQRLNRLGFEKNSKLTRQGSGGATFYLGKNLFTKLAKQKGFDPEEDRLFMKKQRAENGRVVFEITDKAFRKDDK